MKIKILIMLILTFYAVDSFAGWDSLIKETINTANKVLDSKGTDKDTKESKNTQQAQPAPVVSNEVKEKNPVQIEDVTQNQTEVARQEEPKTVQPDVKKLSVEPKKTEATKPRGKVNTSLSDSELLKLSKAPIAYMSEVGLASAGGTLGNFLDALTRKQTPSGNRFKIDVRKSGSIIEVAVDADGKVFKFSYEYNDNDGVCLIKGVNFGGKDYDSNNAMAAMGEFLSATDVD